MFENEILLNVYLVQEGEFITLHEYSNTEIHF